MKTENLAIILTDIVGYTEATSRLSRKEQKEMLNLHNKLMFPIIRNFGGRVVKTIGDALLLVFRSPTDAMLCSMAMQDALFDFNRRSPSGHELHIRIAASLGEVRVARNDVFGEAVNLTSRIESITPEDEIYLSEAIYLAMNKAEVPCVDVGLKELKGITEPVRIWKIPRFTRSRLVPEAEGAEENELSYPYGGAHLDVETKISKRPERKLPVKGVAVGVLLLGGVAGAAYLVAQQESSLPTEVSSPAVEKEKAPAEPVKAAEKPPARVEEKTPVKPKPVVLASKPEPTPKPAPVKPPEPPANPYEDLLAQLKSDQGADMRLAARRISRENIDDPGVLKELVSGLERHYQDEGLDRVMVDALSWYCKVLAATGKSEYVSILEQVSEGAPNAKLKKYASRSLTTLRSSL